MSIQVRSLAEGDFFNWLDLYAEYGAFYDTQVTDEKALRLWSWLIDPRHELEGVVAVDDDLDGKLIGLAHFREFARPLDSSRGLYLDDLFVNPEVRGRGTGRAIMDHISNLARERGLSVVRWITAQDNETAIILYDQVATRTDWVTYELTPSDLSP